MSLFCPLQSYGPDDIWLAFLVGAIVGAAVLVFLKNVVVGEPPDKMDR